MVRNSFSYNFIFNLAKLRNFHILEISGNQSFISQILKVVCPLGGKFDFFLPLEFEIRSTLDHKPSKIKFFPGRAFIWHLKDKILIHDVEMSTIFKGPVKLMQGVKKLIHFYSLCEICSSLSF